MKQRSVPTQFGNLTLTEVEILNCTQDEAAGIEMFAKVGIPVLGIVENMAVHICSQCGHSEHIFGAEGGELSDLREERGALGPRQHEQLARLARVRAG